MCLKRLNRSRCHFGCGLGWAKEACIRWGDRTLVPPGEYNWTVHVQQWCSLTTCLLLLLTYHHHTTTILWPFFRNHPGEPVPEKNFWTLWCKGRLTDADTLTIRLGATPSGLTSAHFHHPPYFLQAGCPSCRPTNSVKALKATNALGL